LRHPHKLSIIRRKKKDRENDLAKSQWSFQTAVELTAALAAKKVSAVELAKDAIARIERHDAKINAICVRDFERGLEAARAADAALSRGEKRPLLGIPMTVKESYNVAGLPTTWGFPQQKNFVPGEDALSITASGRRRRHPRQDQRAARARRLAELQRYLRRHQQPLDLGRTPADRPAAPRRRCAPATVRCRSAPTSAARCACRPSIAASKRTKPTYRAGARARPHPAPLAAAAARPRPRRDRPDGAQRG
jgi:hypothetical protein